MKYTLAFRDVSLGNKEVLLGSAEKVLQRRIETLEKKLSNFKDDLPELSIVIKKHEKHHFYSGVLTLRLPKKSLIANTGAHALEEVLVEGFNKLEKEFETYKGKHFKGSSKYPHHDVIAAEA